jgi:hypothetical protein
MKIYTTNLQPTKTSNSFLLWIIARGNTIYRNACSNFKEESPSATKTVAMTCYGHQCLSKYELQGGRRCKLGYGFVVSINKVPSSEIHHMC